MNDFTQGFGTGAVPHQPDARDWQIGLLPGVAGVALNDLAEEIDHTQFVWSIENQGPLPACQSYSVAMEQSAYEKMEGDVLRFDGAKIYWDNGGNGKDGIPSARVLKYAVDSGLPILGAQQARKLQSYAFTQSVEDIHRALCAGHLVVVAALLPADWWKGDCESMVMTGAYHQFLICKSNRVARRFGIANSWGRSWGRGGFGSIVWDYFTQQNNQNGYFYAYTTIDVIEHGAQPINAPVIVGYTDMNGNPISHYTPGFPFHIVGNGFGSDAGWARLGTLDLKILGWSDREVACTLSDSDSLKPFYGKASAVSLGVKSFPGTVSGPPLTLDMYVPLPLPTPTPKPDPVKITRIRMKVSMTRKLPLLGGGGVIIITVTNELTGALLERVPLRMTLNGRDYGTHLTSRVGTASFAITKEQFHGVAIVSVDDPHYQKLSSPITLG